MLGYSEGELPGRNIDEIFSEGFDFDELKKVPEKQKVEDYGLKFLTKEKKEVAVGFNGTIMNDSERKILGLVGMLNVKEGGE